MKYIFLILCVVGSLISQTLRSEEPLAKLPGEIVLGDASAPMLIHAYTSLTCGHCAVFHHEVFPLLKKNYIDTGRARFIFRHYPIDLRGTEATALVMAVSPIKHMQVISQLFQHQNRWVEAKDPSAFFAEISGLTPAQCQKIIKNKEQLKPAMEARLAADKQVKIDGTPFFVINGRIINYAPSWEELEKYLKPAPSA